MYGWRGRIGLLLGLCVLLGVLLLLVVLDTPGDRGSGAHDNCGARHSPDQSASSASHHDRCSPFASLGLGRRAGLLANAG